MNYLYRFLRLRGNELRVAVSTVFAVFALASKAHAQVTTLLDLENSPGQDYTLYTYSFQAQLAQTFLTFEFRQDPAYWRLDDVSVLNSANTQLIANGGFDGGAYGGQNTPNSWTLIGQAGLNAGGQVVGGCGLSGSSCYMDGAVGGVDGLYQSFATTIGATYSLSFWLQADGGGPASAVVQIGATLDEGGVLIPPPTATDIITTGSPYLTAGLGTTLNPVFDGGTLQLDSSGPVFSQNFTVNNTNGTIDTAGLNSTMSGELSGPGGLTFMNSGSAGGITLTNTNTYAGATVISGGTTLALSGAGSIADSSGVADNGIFDISATTAGASIQSLSGNGAVVLGNQNLNLSNAADTFAGSIGGTGSVVLSGGVEILSGVNTFSGATGIGSGATLALSGTGSIAASSGVADDGIFNISATSGASIQSLSGNGTVVLGNQKLTLSNASDTFAGSIGGAGSVVLSGGVETLSGVNTFTGATGIGSGASLALSGTGSIAASSGVADNGIFDISATTAGASIQSLSGSGAVALGSKNLTISNAAGTFAGDIGGSGGLTLTGGAETLSGVNTFTGATGISSGATLALSGTGSIAASSAVIDNGAFNISATTAGASIQSLSGNGVVALGNQNLNLSNAFGTFAGAIGGTGGVALTGGAETLSGVNTFTGATGIGSGATLVLSGSGSIAASSGVADNGTFNISASTLTASIQSLSGSGTVVLGNQNLNLTNAGGTFAGTMGGAGGLSLTGGTETLSGVNTFTGATGISGGATLALTGAGSTAASSGIADNGTFDISGTSAGASIQSLSGNGAVALGNQNLNLSNAADTFAGNIGGTGNVALSSGVETLSGVNTFAGTTGIGNGATLALSGTGSIASSSAVANNGIFDISATTAGASIQSLAGTGAVALGNQNLNLTNAGGTFAGAIGGTGGIALTGGTEALSGVNAFTGATGISGGATLALTGAGSIAASSGVADNGIFDISSTTAGAAIQSLSGNGAVTLGNQNLNLSNAVGSFAGAIGGAGGLALTGGIETLSGANTFTGATGIGSGSTLALTGVGSIAASNRVADNGTFDVSGTTAGATIQSLSGNGAVVLGNQNLNLSNAAGTFAGSIGGMGSVTLTGGTETLSGTNTYVGGTTVSGGGRLIVGADVGLGSSAGLLTLNAGTLQSTASFAMTRDIALAGDGTFVTDTGTTMHDGGAVTGAGALIKSGAGSMELCGNVSNSGGTTVAAGQLMICGSDTGTGSVSVANGATLALTGAGSIAASSGLADNGTFDISGTTAGAAIQSLSGTGVVALGNQNLNLSNAVGTFAGSISGTGGLAVTGGAQTLGAVNAFTGATAIGNGATLALIGTGSVAASSGVVDNGTFDISGTTAGAAIQSLSGNGTVALGNQSLALTNAIGTFTGSIAGTGGLAVTGGAQTLGGVNTFTGATAIGNGATVALTGTGSIAASSGVADNGTLDISGTAAGAAIQSLSGSGAVALGNQNLGLSNAGGTFAGAIAGTGGVALTGGAETLSGVNTFTGATGISGGATLALTGAGSIAASSGVANNGTFDISATGAGASIRSLSGAGTVALGNQILTLSHAGDAFAGTISGSGSLAITGGTETLSGTNNYTGGTSVSGGGQLIVGADAALGNSSGTLTLAGGTLQSTASFAMTRSLALAGDGTLDTNGGTTLHDNGALTGAGALIKSGLGALELCGNVSNAGGISVSAGSLAICGNNTGTGGIAITTGATLALTGAGSIARSSGVSNDGTFDISGTTAGAAIQSLSGNGTVALGGQNLALTNAAGTFSGAIGGTGGLALTGGTETLTGTNTYTGGTMVSGSKLIITGDAALGGASGALTLNNATLENAASVDSARSITLIGSNILSTDPGATLTQTGRLSGDGHVTKVGDGTLILAGDNRNWGQQGNTTVGGLTINSGLVEVENSYGLGFGLITVNGGVISTTVDVLTGQTIQINGATVLNVDPGTTTTLTGTVETTGTGSCFEKTGTGTLIMSGTATLRNGTCVEEGQLYANGSITSAMRVDPGAILRGVGTITGPVTVQGILAPGNSPGTLTVVGNVTMQAGSTYQEDVNGVATGAGPGSYSRLLVAGAANQFIATGATLNVNLLNITGTTAYTPFQPALGDSFRIVTAEGGIVGKFAAFGQPDGLAANTRLAIFYDPFGDNSIDLRVVPISYTSFLQAAGANSNARSVGNAMNQVLNADQAGHASVAQDNLAYALGGMSAAALPGVMTALAGEVHADLAAVAPQAGQWLASSVARQLEFSSADGEMGAPLPGQAFWFDTTANHGKWDADDRASGFTTNRTQTAAGFDLLVGHGNRVGVGFSHSLIDVSTSAGSGSVNENIGFVYGQYSLAAVIFDGMFGAGTNHWETDRADPLGLSAATLDTNRRGHTALAGAGIRLPWNVGGVDLEPYARTLWQRLARSSFDEGTALDALSGPDYSANGLRTSAGILIGPKNSSPLAAPFGYQVNLGAGYDSGSLVHPTVAATLAGTPTAIMAPDIGRAFAQLSLNGTARLGEHTYAYAGLTGEARSGKAEDAGINLGVRASF